MSLDNLIPTAIREKCNSTEVQIEIILAATSANGRWPSIRLLVNSEQAINKTADSPIITIDYSAEISNKVCLELEYYGKTADDTVVSNGNIIENQSIEILGLVINGIDVVKNSLIYKLGEYTMVLSPEKHKFFTDNGINTGPSHSLMMAENGSWKLTLEVPILAYLIKLSNPYFKHERWNHSNLDEIYNVINEIRELEQQLKIKN
jgi:hypothetical protein